MELHNWISLMDPLWSYIIQLRSCKSKELDNSIVQLCNWFLEIRTFKSKELDNSIVQLSNWFLEIRSFKYGDP